MTKTLSGIAKGLTIEKCGCTELKFMSKEAQRNFQRYLADRAEVPRKVRRLWQTLDDTKFWPPHLQARAKGVTRRIGMCGEVMDSIAARWMLDHATLGG